MHQIACYSAVAGTTPSSVIRSLVTAEACLGRAAFEMRHIEEFALRVRITDLGEHLDELQALIDHIRNTTAAQL